MATGIADGLDAADVPAGLDAPPQADAIIIAIAHATGASATAEPRKSRHGLCSEFTLWMPLAFIDLSFLEARVLMTVAESTPVPAVGQVAPDFTLPSTSNDKVTLSALRGKPVLLAFFPLAFSGTCTAELCQMRDDHLQFADRGVTVLPISVDHTYSLKEYKAKHGMKVDLLSDFKRDVSRLYGVLLQEKYYSTRAYFLIDRDGVIRWEHVEENPSNRREDSEILTAIDQLPA